MLRVFAKVAIVGVFGVALLVGAGYWWRCHTYPYGFSHSCDKILSRVLHDYAEAHDGFFPAGEATPEASLSLLYPEYANAKMLHGKTVPLELVGKRLERGELLTPDTCGWHYVEGLTLADDGRLALFWDKVGLGHNGERLSGGHFVCFVGWETKHIPESEWPQFLKEQEALHAARSKAAKEATRVLLAKVRSPSGEIVESLDAPFALDYFEGDESGLRYGGRNGDRLTPRDLSWWRLEELRLRRDGEGTLTLTLSLDDRRSKPVTVNLSDGELSPSSILFEIPKPEEEGAVSSGGSLQHRRGLSVNAVGFPFASTAFSGE